MRISRYSTNSLDDEYEEDEVKIKLIIHVSRVKSHKEEENLLSLFFDVHAESWVIF